MSSEKRKTLQISKWDEAISDARRKIADGKFFVARLRSAIKTFEKKKAAGEPWPVRSHPSKIKGRNTVFKTLPEKGA